MVSPKIPYLWVFHFLSPLCSPSNPTFSSYCFSILYFLSLKPHLLFLMLFYLVFPLPQTSPSLPIAFLPCISSPYNLTFFSYDFTPSQSTMSFFSFFFFHVPSSCLFLSTVYLSPPYPFLSFPFFLFHASSTLFTVGFFPSFCSMFLRDPPNHLLSTLYLFPPFLSFLYLPYLLLFPSLFLRDSPNRLPPPLSLLLHPFHPYLIIHTSLSMLVHTSFST